MRVAGPMLPLTLLLLQRCWLRLQSAVGENSTFEVKWGGNKASKASSHHEPCCQRCSAAPGMVRMQAFLSGNVFLKP